MQLLPLLSSFLLLVASSSAGQCPPPPPPNVPKCKDHPVFKLTDIAYFSTEIYSTPSHLAVHYGTFSFNLTNSAVPYVTHCSATSQAWTVPFYGQEVYTCEKPTGPGVGADAVTTFTYSELDHSIHVNQTWNCYDNKLHATTKLLGNGADTVAWTCNTTNYNNPDWQIGETYSSKTTTCGPKSMNIKPTVIKA